MEDRNLGEQPLVHLMEELGLSAEDLVKASPDQLTYKMVSRACKGRRLTPNVQRKVCEALNAASKEDFAVHDLFDY